MTKGCTATIFIDDRRLTCAFGYPEHYLSACEDEMHEAWWPSEDMSLFVRWTDDAPSAKPHEEEEADALRDRP